MTMKAAAVAVGCASILSLASACTTDHVVRTPYEGPPVGARPAPRGRGGPGWDDAVTRYRCIGSACSARFAITLTTDHGYEPTVRVTLANLDRATEDSLELPLSILGQREIQFTGLPEGEYESFVTVADADRQSLDELGIDEMRAYVEFSFTADR
jgi:hypothetical protein